MLWKAQELPPSSIIFGIGPASVAQDVTCTFGHLQRGSALRRTARQKTPRMPRKPPRPGSHPGRSSSTSTSHRTMKAARKRRLASAHSPPPQMTPVDYSLFRRRGARRGASLVDRGRRQRRCDGLASYRPATGHEPARQNARQAGLAGTVRADSCSEISYVFSHCRPSDSVRDPLSRATELFLVRQSCRSFHDHPHSPCPPHPRH